MFDGDSAALPQVIGQAVAVVRQAGAPRVGSEHLLLALTMRPGAVRDVLAAHGATSADVRAALREVPAAGAGAAADQALLASIGVDVGDLLDGSTLDHPPSREPVFPLGRSAARRRSRDRRPAWGLDGQAAYEASLRLALARRERDHRPEHLALTLVTLDGGVQFVLAALGVDPTRLTADLATAFPPPQRNRLLRIDRRLGRYVRQRDISRRYQHTTGRFAELSPSLISG